MSSIISPDADFSNSKDWDPPFDGFEYINFFRGGAANVARNLAPGGGACVKAGAPAYGNGYARFQSQSNFIQTAVTDSPAKTIITASRGVGVNSTPSTRPLLIGNYSASTLVGGGMSIFVQDEDRMQFSTMTNSAGAASFATGFFEPIDPNSWAIRVARFIPGTGMIYDDLTNALHGTVATALAHEAANNLFRIGSGYSASWMGTSDHVADAIINRAITDNELADLAALFRSVAARDGIIL